IFASASNVDTRLLQSGRLRIDICSTVCRPVLNISARRIRLGIILSRSKKWRGNVMKNNRGFSLLELLIVVAIILIIATIAIPSMLRSRQAANESHAIANLRTLNTAEVQ